MKIISLLQPWAQLLVHGHKSVETRSWSTKYRGPIFIHASGALNKKMDNGLTPYEMATSNEHFRKCIINPNLMKFGCIVGMVNLEAVLQIHHSIPPPEQQLGQLTLQEFAFGNYEVGRFMWFCTNPVEFKRPITVKGTQGLRDYTGTTHCMYCDQGYFPVKGIHEFERSVYTCPNIKAW